MYSQRQVLNATKKNLKEKNTPKPKEFNKFLN